MPNKGKLVLISAVSLLPSCFGLWWLSIGFIIYLSIHGIFYVYLKKIASQKWLKIFRQILMVLNVFMVAILLRMFVFEICRVPTASMENTVQTGDYIVVNKLAYGPVLPNGISDVPWLQALQPDSYAHKNTATNPTLYSRSFYRRLTGYDNIQRMDIIIFDDPVRQNELLVKRLIGLPGDTLQMIDGTVFVNGSKLQMPETGKSFFRLFCRVESKLFQELQNQRKIWDKKRQCFLLNLTPVEASTFQELAECDSIHPSIDAGDPGAKGWPGTLHPNWTRDNFGPIVISEKQKNGKINNNNSTDLYFVLGDNRSESIDSRTFGLIPEKSIKGKASAILFSSASDKSLFRRIIKIPH
ncbi:signal peptidase I [Flavilitoribacter nigricans]|uniref:Signal peptidase I n=1 Tax=Flavilitoribacter nigricans (strain ATCC 23147 / DSM 23189 / NBRC 102662 / NCIMB 1420 / SS-2) TaxID=1122177 RepID=A0A2D0MYC0_FLAN2|nr:signal peptidase I [Flavilitoribacter nigricans]PHN01281.1 signal peptidase I [Flavilitoribacter nigricans DSM 23189 = NBRC 102662]